VVVEKENERRSLIKSGSKQDSSALCRFFIRLKPYGIRGFQIEEMHLTRRELLLKTETEAAD
jgi:hypothetical protein